MSCSLAPQERRPGTLLNPHNAQDSSVARNDLDRVSSAKVERPCRRQSGLDQGQAVRVRDHSSVLCQRWADRDSERPVPAPPSLLSSLNLY
jgi:hypothetical protein